MVWRPVAVLRGPMRDKGRELDLIAGVGLGVLVVMALSLHVAHLDGSGDARLFRGGFLAVDLATVAVMAAVTHRRAAAGALLGTPVLVWIGTRSYGLYLYHWPIYQMMRDPSGAGLSVAQFAGALVLTVLITEAVVPLHRDPDPSRQLHHVVAPATRRPRGAGPACPRGGRCRRDGARRLLGREHGDSRDQTHPARAVVALRATGGERHHRPGSRLPDGGHAHRRDRHGRHHRRDRHGRHDCRGRCRIAGGVDWVGHDGPGRRRHDHCRHSRVRDHCRRLPRPRPPSPVPPGSRSRSATR